MSTPPSAKRPLSPHLQIYRPQITSVLSILHRLTGLGLSASLIFFVYWLGSIANGPDSFQISQNFFQCFFVQLAFLGIIFSFYYHLANGIRHLFWDIGHGYELSTVHKTGWFVVFFSVCLTFLTGLFIWS